MSLTTYRVEVDNPDAYGGDATFDVDVDGRDWAAMELKELPPAAIVTRARFLAWNALTRTGRTRRSWEQFNLRDAVGIDDVTPTDGAEGEQGLDPGPATPNGPGVSTSRSRPGSRSTARPG